MVNVVNTQNSSISNSASTSVGSSADLNPSIRPFLPALLLPGLVGSGLFALLVVCFYPTLIALGKSWRTNPEYSHGFVVPLFTVFLLWSRRQYLEAVALRPSAPSLSLWGVGFFGLMGVLRTAAALMGIDYLDSMAFIAGLFGVFALVGGWPAIRWAWPALLFLLFMIPLPFTVAHSLSGSLRSIATLSSAYLLQTIGFPVVTEGHVILLGEHQIAVAEACSGLSMLYVFVALATGVTIYIDRPWFDRLVIVLSSLPIAILANCLRIAFTAFAFQVAGKEMGEFIFHDLAGWVMMPLALAMMWLVLKFLDQVLVATTAESPLTVRGLPSASATGA
jgi:exosortase